VLECEWLVGRLLAKYGVATATWERDTQRLLVEYDADLCGRAELIAFLQSCGVSASAVGVARCVGSAKSALYPPKGASS